MAPPWNARVTASSLVNLEDLEAEMMDRCGPGPLWNAFMAQPRSSRDINEMFQTAAHRNQFWAMEPLRARGADPSALKGAALTLAAQGGFLPIVDYLIPLSGPTADYGWALRNAVVEGHLDVARRLLPLCDPSQVLTVALQEEQWVTVDFLGSSPGMTRSFRKRCLAAAAAASPSAATLVPHTSAHVQATTLGRTLSSPPPSLPSRKARL